MLSVWQTAVTSVTDDLRVCSWDRHVIIFQPSLCHTLNVCFHSYLNRSFTQPLIFHTWTFFCLGPSHINKRGFKLSGIPIKPSFFLQEYPERRWKSTLSPIRRPAQSSGSDRSQSPSTQTCCVPATWWRRRVQVSPAYCFIRPANICIYNYWPALKNNRLILREIILYWLYSHEWDRKSDHHL